MRQMETTWDSKGKGLMRRCPDIVVIIIVVIIIPTAAPMTELVDSHSRLNAKGVLLGQFLTLRPVFWPTLGLFGENCQLRLLLVWAK